MNTSGLKDALSFSLFAASIAFMGFLYGVATLHYEWFPSWYLRNAATSIGTSLSRLWEPEPFLHPVVHDHTGTRTFNENAVSPGVTLLATWFEGAPGVRLIDQEGNVLQSWAPPLSKIWSADDLEGANWKAGEKPMIDYIHGCHLLENGDIIFNSEHTGLVRMAASGEVVWAHPIASHHSVAPTEDGNFWICGMRRLDAGNERLEVFPGTKPTLFEDLAVLVNPEGEVLKEFGILESLKKAGYYRLIWSDDTQPTGDVLHLNDVEPLPSGLADEYPLFAAGDIVVSMCFISTIAVLDPDDGHVKWLSSNEFHHQHDPDFIGDGWIRVFDNNTEPSDRGDWLGGSRIVDIRPHTGEVRVVFPKEGSDAFYTPVCGKAQTLANGNILITESLTGRVFEVNAAGETVWEWIHTPWPGEPMLVSEVFEGTRYDIPLETIQSWTGQEQTTQRPSRRVAQKSND